MIPNPSNSLLGNNGQPTLEQIQQRLAQQVQDNQNPNTGQQLIDLLQQSTAAMALKPGAGAEADQTLQQLNPTGTQSMQNLQNMRQEIEQERATDEYPFYDEKQLQAEFERQKKAEDKQWQTFISSYKQEMKDKISQEHKDHVTFMTATGGTPLNLGEFAQQTGYLGGNKLQEAWEAHKENAENVPPSNLYDDYNQTLLDSMEHRDNFDMERYTDLFHQIGKIQERIFEHHAKGVDDLSQDNKYEVQNLMQQLRLNAREIDEFSGSSRNAKNKEAEIHIKNIFPNGFNPSLFDDAILVSDPKYYLKSNFKLNAHDVQNVTAEHHLAEVHPDTFNRIKESNLPLGLKNSIINSNSLIPLYEQLADDIIEAHEAVDYTDTPHGIGNRIHEQLKDKYRSLTLKDEIRQPTISFEKLLYNKFSQSSHQNVRHLKNTMTAFNRHYDDDDSFTGSLFDYGLGNGFDFDIFDHLELANQEKRNKKLQDVFKSPLDYVIDNLIAKANLPILKRQNLTRQYADYLDDMMYNTNPAYSSLRLQTEKHPSPVKGRRLANTENIRFQNSPIFEQRGKKLPLSLDGVPLSGRYVYPNEAFSFNPSFFGKPRSPDLPVSTRHGTVEMQNKLSQQGISNPFSNANPLHLYGFEAGPQRYGKNAQTEGIIYGDLDEANVHRLTNKPYSSREFINVARTLMPQFNRTPAMLSTEKEQDLASTLMNLNIPPVLTDEHLTVDNPNDPMQISSIHDPERQWRSQSQERLLENLEPYKIASEPMDIAMRLLKANEGGQPTVPTPRYHEMSNEDLGNILHGWGYDVGEGKYKTDESLSTQEEKDAAYQELLNRQREAEANPVSVFSLNEEEKSRLADFYEPQFTGQNIDPDTFIPQTEEEGLQAYGDMEEGELDDHIEDRLLAIDEFMPGKSFMADQDPMAKYHHLKTTAGDEVAENYLNRYRDFVMRHSENPEYMYQQLMQMLGEIPEVTAPQYTQKFPTDESIFDNKPPNVMMNAPDATGFEHDWQAKNASEPMDLAIDALLKRDFDSYEIHPGENQYKHRYKMPNRDDVHPEWYDWIQETLDNPAEYEGIADDFQQPDINHLAGATSREDFFERLYDLHNFQVDDARPPFDDIEGKYRDFTDVPFNEETGFTRSEPMDLAMDVLLKDRISPEAKRHKLEYDKKYESSPERVKYREELNRERRKRGIYGKHNHMDVSHTEGGKLTLESEHGNRARHFKEKGTLRHEE